ncbi:amidohydrolase family protein [Candidatus Palauibacter sp.]|uniref:amidohydrolase family protein n=1 Tax=Candidatus Palauibacter sp. TaxID=3101350 RepID=UPI003B523094
MTRGSGNTLGNTLRNTTNDRIDTMVKSIVATAAVLGTVALALPAQAAAQEGGTFAVQGATIHTVADGVIENGTIVLRDGRIIAVGRDVEIPADAEIIDGEGKHVFPGMIDAFSSLGLTEIGAVAVTNDASELGRWNPHLNAHTAIHPASEHIPVARANGITHTMAAPGGGGRFGGGGGSGIQGQATLIHLDGWTVEEMEIEKTAAMVLGWPTLSAGGGRFGGFGGGGGGGRSFRQARERFDEQVAEMDEWFVAAQHYRQAVESGSNRVPRNIQLEHLSRVLDRGMKVIVRANGWREIESAIEFAEKWNLDLVIAGGTGAREIAGTLAEKNVPVILGPVQRLPQGEDTAYDDPNTLPGVLHDAGVEIAFATFNSADSRTLPYEAANSVSWGLTKDAALEAVTLAPARVLGVDDRLGSLEVGKVGNLIVTDGDPLEITTEIEWVFIKGVPSDLDNKHRSLWEKYDNRPARRVTTTTT